MLVNDLINYFFRSITFSTCFPNIFRIRATELSNDQKLQLQNVCSFAMTDLTLEFRNKMSQLSENIHGLFVSFLQ